MNRSVPLGLPEKVRKPRGAEGASPGLGGQAFQCREQSGSMCRALNWEVA